MRTSLTLGATALLIGLGHAALAQTPLDCQTITNDVMVTDLHAYMPSADAGSDQAGLGDRTSGQILARWATIQDPSSEACGTLKLVEQRLAAEAQFAASACAGVVPMLRQRMEAARSEMTVSCRGQ